MIFLFKSLSWTLRLFPTGFVRRFGRMLGALVGDVFGFRRKVVEQNISRAFQFKENDAQVSKIASENYRHYGETVFEILTAMTWEKQDYLDRVTYHGLENILPLVEKGQGGVLLGSHMGNWEIEIGSVGAKDIPFDCVVKRSNSPGMDRVMKWSRERAGVRTFWEEGTAKAILKSIRAGRFVGMVLDQFMGPPIGLPVKFFGHQAGTAAGLALLSERFNFPVVPVSSFRDESGRLNTVFEPPVEVAELAEDKNTRLYQRTQAYNDALERHVRKNPAQWLWLHRRWKEFRGAPRWVPATVGLALLFVGCAGAPVQRRAIVIPPDPKIEVPVKKVQASKKKISREQAAKAPRVPPLKIPILEKGRIPFRPGEQMTLSLSWTLIPAGKAVLEVRPSEPMHGRPTFKLWGNVATNTIVSSIYSLDNTIESFVDTEGFIPYKFLLSMDESKQKKETRVVFDHVNKKAHFWAERVSKQWGDAKDDRADFFKPLAKDMFSALYYARTLEYEKGKQQSYFVYENGQMLELVLTPIKKELITVPVGAFQCWKIKVDLKLNNVLKPSGDVFIYLSADYKKYIVKFDAKLKIGSLVGRLIDLKD